MFEFLQMQGFLLSLRMALVPKRERRWKMGYELGQTDGRVFESQDAAEYAVYCYNFSNHFSEMRKRRGRAFIKRIR